MRRRVFRYFQYIHKKKTTICGLVVCHTVAQFESKHVFRHACCNIIREIQPFGSILRLVIQIVSLMENVEN